MLFFSGRCAVPAAASVLGALEMWLSAAAPPLSLSARGGLAQRKLGLVG